MRFPDLVDELKARAPQLRGRLFANAPIAETHLVSRRRAGAGSVFARPTRTISPMSWPRCRARSPITTIGLGSNLIVRDGGVAGVVIRLGGRAFGAIEITDDCRVVAGAAAPDQFVAKRRGEGGRRRPCLPARRARVDRRRAGDERRRAWRRDQGRARSKRAASIATARGASFSNADMGFSYRHSGAPDDVIFTGAMFQGRPGEPAGDRSRDGAHHPRARGLAADPREDRRLDLQEPAGHRRPGS